MAGVALAAIVGLVGCAAEVDGTAEVDGVDRDVGVATQRLSGKGETFWMPFTGQSTLRIYYCFETLSGMTTRRSQIPYALANTWEAFSRVDFVDEGACSTAPNAWRAIRIRGHNEGGGFVGPTKQDSRFGTELAGLVNGMTLPRDSFSMTTNAFRTVVAHEFGHALGFWHENTRPDWDHNTWDDCPAKFLAPLPFPYAPQTPNTWITQVDTVESIMDAGYCNNRDFGLSDMDKAGVAAIYGASGANVYYNVFFTHFALRFQTNARWLQPTDVGAANTQYFIGPWEKLGISPANGSVPGDWIVRYGHTINIGDRFGRWLSARDVPANEVRMVGGRTQAEQWIVEPALSSRTNGMALEVNFPFRLRSARYPTKYLGVTAGGDVHLTTSHNAAEVRFNGPLLPQ